MVMDPQREDALLRVARMLEGMEEDAFVVVVPAGRTQEAGVRFSWPLDPAGRERTRERLAAHLAALTCHAQVKGAGQTRKLTQGWSLPWPAPAGLFDPSPGDSRGWAERWLAGAGIVRGSGGVIKEDPKGESEPRDRQDAGAEEVVVPQYRTEDEEPARLPPLLQLAGPVLPGRRVKASDDCLRDIEAMLAKAGRRMNGAEIYRGLVEAKRRWGSTTVESTLAEAKRLGTLDYDKGAGGFGPRVRGDGEVYVVPEE